MVKQEEEIKVIAYRLWEKEGRPSGKELEHYFRAEAICEHQHRRADTGKAVQPVANTSRTSAQPAGGEGTETQSGHHRSGHHRRRKGEHHHGHG
jgi:hypothetical protein